MPRPNTPLVHPELENAWDEVGGFPQTCTIQQLSESLDAVGQQADEDDEGNWTDVVPLVNIPCRLAAVGNTGLTGETERMEMTFAVSSNRIRLKGYWPEIQEEHSAVVDGVRYDIEVVEHSSEHNATSLRVEKVT